MRVIETPLSGVVLIEPQVFGDDRGFLVETFSFARYRDAGIDSPNIQDNFVRSCRGTLRGLHYQEPDGQGKLVQVLRGEIFDVCVDVRRGSPTFAKWLGFTLSEDDVRQLWIPVGFAHGFCVTSETADVYYKMSGPRVAEHERVIAWNDPAIGITWPIAQPLLSPRDACASKLTEAVVLPKYEK